MSLDFNYKDCNKSLLTDEHYEGTVETVVFATMGVGISHITKLNYDKFIMRLMMLDAARGNHHARNSSSWSAIVIPWIGLRTNASELTDMAFIKRCKEISEETMRYIRLGNAEDLAKAEVNTGRLGE